VVGKPDDKDAIHVYTRLDSAPARADMWALFCGGKVQADLFENCHRRQREPALVDTVIKDPLGIAYSNLNSVFHVTSGNIGSGPRFRRSTSTALVKSRQMRYIRTQRMRSTQIADR